MSGRGIAVPALSQSIASASAPPVTSPVSPTSPLYGVTFKGPPVIVRRVPSPYLGKNVIQNAGAAPLRCQVCHQVFVCNEYLNVHLMTHTGQLGPDDGNPTE